MEINEYKIRLSGTANIPRELKNTDTYDLTISNAVIDGKSFKPNEDGTENLIHSVKISEMSEVNLIGVGDIIPAKKKGSQSAVLHWELCKEADELGIDREEHYKSEMTKFISEVKERNGL